MKRKALFIGGTGTISMAITRLVAESTEWELTLLNRGTRNDHLPEGVNLLRGDICDEHVAEVLRGYEWDVVADFIAFTPEQVERDFALFQGHTRQYIFISSASAYMKPCPSYLITEATPLQNPYWQYSRDKAACEDLLHRHSREDGFPVTIVRPSHTYDERHVPVAVHGDKGSWQVIRRIDEGKPVIIPGDGTSLWTLTFNRDFARGFVGLMGNIHALGQTYQIMSDESLTWNQIYQSIADALGRKLNPCYVPSTLLATSRQYDFEGNLLGDKAHTVVFDTTHLKQAVPGFCCTTRFDQGVRIALDHIRSHPELQEQDPRFDSWCDKVAGVMRSAEDRLRSLMLTLLLLITMVTTACAQDARKDVFQTPGGKEVAIYAIKHASIRISYDGREIEVDPVGRLNGNDTDYSQFPRADYVLVTHEHDDHLSPETVRLLTKEGTLVVANANSARQLDGARVMRNGDKLQLAADIELEAVPAYNTTPGHTQYHPKGRDNGYILTLDGLRIYIAGDTEDIAEMKDLKGIDIAFLPTNQPYTMTPEQTARAAQMFLPRVLFPYHYSDTRIEEVKRLLEQSPIDVRIRDYR